MPIWVIAHTTVEMSRRLDLDNQQMIIPNTVVCSHVRQRTKMKQENRKINAIEIPAHTEGVTIVFIY